MLTATNDNNISTVTTVLELPVGETSQRIGGLLPGWTYTFSVAAIVANDSDIWGVAASLNVTTSKAILLTAW